MYGENKSFLGDQNGVKKLLEEGEGGYFPRYIYPSLFLI